jgi:GNAT superfamily N-acetyltransferase
MALRLATRGDIAAMHQLRLSVLENNLSDPGRVVLQDYVSMIEEHGRGWVYEVDGAIVGFAVGNDRRRNIWALFVAPGFEGRGIGRALHDTMVTWLFERSREPLWLTTEPNTRAERFYVAAGWQRKGIETNGELRFELTDTPIHGAVELLTVCEWTGRSMQSTEIHRPSWESVETAIRALDNASRNDIYLTPRTAEPETYLCIGGGAGRYVVTGSINGQVFPTVVDAGRAAEPSEVLVVGGQSGQYPRNWVLDLATTLRAARHFHMTGRFEGEVTWINA